MQNRPWIFLSYRRREIGHLLADRIASELEIKCGQNSVFVDTRGIEAGTNWPSVIQQTLSECMATVVVIQEDWPLHSLRHPHDWVRLEIAKSLQHRKYILPLFIDGGRMPPRDTLPEDIQGLADRQGVYIDSRSDKVFAAALSVVSDDIRNGCPSSIIFERKLEASCSTMAENAWHLHCDGDELGALHYTERANEFQVSSGVHSFYATWRESWPGINSSNRGATDGSTSFGQTKPVTMSLVPGRYRMTLIVDREAQDNRGWLRKAGDFFGKTYDSYRRLVVDSFERTQSFSEPASADRQ